MSSRRDCYREGVRCLTALARQRLVLGSGSAWPSRMRNGSLLLGFLRRVFVCQARGPFAAQAGQSDSSEVLGQARPCPGAPSNDSRLQAGRLRLLRGVVAPLALALLTLACQVEAQVITFVSNVYQPKGCEEGVYGTATHTTRNQRFTTGSHAAGYLLDGIDMTVTTRSGVSYAAYLCALDTDGYPFVDRPDLGTDSSCVSLTKPTSGTKHTPPPETVLAPDTTYSAIVEKTAGPSYDSHRVIISTTWSDGEDLWSVAGWSIADEYDFWSEINTDWRTTTIEICDLDPRDRAVRIAVKGTTIGASTLSALALSDGMLIPTFSSAQMRYDASVALLVSRITVIPTSHVGTDFAGKAIANRATVAYLDEDDLLLTDADTSSPNTFEVDLGVGANVVKVKVTAEDGNTTQTYTVTVIRGVSSDAKLKALTLSEGTLEPNFSPTHTSYSAMVETSVTRITVMPQTNDPGATVAYLDEDDLLRTDADTSSPNTFEVDLGEGANVVKVKVTAEDGNTTQTYTVTVTREPADATLMALALSHGTLAPNFSPTHASYSAMVETSVTRITVMPQTNDPGATVAYLDEDDMLLTDADTSSPNTFEVDLGVGATVVKVKVTAEYGITTQTYTVTVTYVDDSAVPPGGGGGGGGSANRPPVVEEQIPGQTIGAGEVLELDISRNFYDRNQRALDYTVASSDPCVMAVVVNRQGVLTIRGRSRGVTRVTLTAADRRDERVSQTFTVRVLGPALVALIPRASDPVREGFVRVINHSGEEGEVSIEAIDDRGTSAGTVMMTIGAHAVVHFNSVDLEQGNPAKGLSGGVGTGEGDWRLTLDSELEFEVLSYIRTAEGFLTSMHDRAPTSLHGTAPQSDCVIEVATFNPAINPNQVSHLRLINQDTQEAEVTIKGVDDAGASPGTPVEFEIPAGESLSLTASDLEAGAGVDGALGDGTGKWRLRVTSNEPIVAMSLMSSPTGHLTNLSTVPATPGDEDGTHVAPLFPSASDPLGRQGFVRVVNRSTDAGTVHIAAYDDSDLAYDDVTLSIGAGATMHFNSNDLELGNAAKGLSGSTGAGIGDWRLDLSSELDIQVLAYIRTSDGFLTSMHDVAPSADGRHWVAILNPGSNPNQVSRLRLVNSRDEDARVTVDGVDDAGATPGGPVVLTVLAGASRTLTSVELESGGEGLTGALGEGAGKWRLQVESDVPIMVMSLLESPTGHLTNLSTAPDRGSY